MTSSGEAARRLKVNRSALIRDALREHLERLHYRELERQEREAYERVPDARRVAQLDERRLDEVCAAIAFALGCRG